MVIRIADYTDKQFILDFIDEYWQKNHIFVRWPELFEDYHRNENKINYVIAEEDHKLYGVCGFIYANHKERPDLWLALWKVIPSGSPSLGLDIVRYLHQELNCNILACCGIKKEVKKLYEFLGYKTGTLSHYYRLNEMENYAIATVNHRRIQPYALSETYLEEIKNEEQFRRTIDYSRAVFHSYKPYKDIDYVVRKYFHNIAYQYQVWAIREGNEVVDAILVTKKVEVESGKALRIVDFLGDENKLAQCGAAIDQLLKKNDYEYVDFYEYGLKEETLKDLGMVLKDESDTNIIPNYFEPFVKENIEIYFFSNDLDGFRMFKADGDQERPNFRLDEMRS